MNTVIEKFETNVAGTLEPGSVSHDLAYNVLSSLRKNYNGNCRKTAQRFITVITEWIQLVRDLEDAGIDCTSEVNKAYKALHLFTS